MRYQCPCVQESSSGMPCVHLVSVIASFRAYSYGKDQLRASVTLPALRLSSFFNSYWRRDLTVYRAEIDQVRWQQPAKHVYKTERDA